MAEHAHESDAYLPHVVRAVQRGNREFWPAIEVDCPHDLASLDRDCVTVRCFEGMHGEGCDGDGDQCYDRVPGVCIAQDWLDAAGPDGVAVEGFDGLDYPIRATVSWGGEGPVLTALTTLSTEAGDE